MSHGLHLLTPNEACWRMREGFDTWLIYLECTDVPDWESIRRALGHPISSPFIMQDSHKHLNFVPLPDTNLLVGYKTPDALRLIDELTTAAYMQRKHAFAEHFFTALEI